MKELFKKLILLGNFATPAGERLYYVAKAWVGKDASPADEAPDEYGCAETVNNVVFTAFGDYAGGDVSTYRMYRAIRNNQNFAEVKKPLRGDIILSPTGYGNGKIKNGHVGIMGDNGEIMSNRSDNGLFDTKYTLHDWIKRYQTIGGYPVLFYRRIFRS